LKIYICCPVGGISKQQSTKTVTRKGMHMILWLKTEVELVKKIQALKTQFRREHKELMDSQRSRNSPKKSAWCGYVKVLFLFQGHESRGSSSTHNAEVSFKCCITLACL
jgi:hypothetical protein